MSGMVYRSTPLSDALHSKDRYKKLALNQSLLEELSKLLETIGNNDTMLYSSTPQQEQ